MHAATVADWQALMSATLVPPPERLRFVDPLPNKPLRLNGTAVKPVSPAADVDECQCPESCRMDHEND